MKKTIFLSLTVIFITGQIFAQQPKSFAEHWFGITTQQIEQTKVKAFSVKSAVKAKQSAVKPKATGIVTLDLSQPANPETFDLDDNGVWVETYNDTDYPFIEFNNSTFMLTHLVGGEGTSYGGVTWDGFTYSKNADSSSQADWYTNHFGNMAAGGIQIDSEGNVITNSQGKPITSPDIPYLVAYWAAFTDGAYDYHILTTIFDDIYQAKSIYVNNSPWAYHSNINGDGFARPLNQAGDYLKLIIHGLNEAGEDNGKTVEHYLARNEGGTLIQSPYWELIDLTPLGEIGGLYFTMSSTDNNASGMKTAAYFCIDRLQVAQLPPSHNYTITVPTDATVEVSYPDYTGYNYRPFTVVDPVFFSYTENNAIYYYSITGKHAYRVIQADKLTQTGTFTPSSTDSTLEITAEQMNAHTPDETDHNVNANEGCNVADIFTNINPQGHLQLALGDSFQIIPHRNWTLVDNTLSNYFLEPDFRYSVINEDGSDIQSVVTVNSAGLLTATGNGTAIVFVRYDAVNAHHTDNGPFFGALWEENTGVFVVTVGANNSGITSGMVINEMLNTDPAHKMATTAVDAELDVFYYLSSSNGYDYTFTPTGVTSVEISHFNVNENNMISFSGFSTEGVTAAGGGSYTVRLTEGRNIVKLISATGAVYQVLTAKALSYLVNNISRPGETIMHGDKISVTFNTLYHPCGKLAGVYNMSAGIQYNGIEANVPTHGLPMQYNFASSRAQEYRISIPQNFSGNTFKLTNGVIKANGFGSPYGSHRSITLEDGIDIDIINDYALRTAYFGALPQIDIPVGSVGLNDMEKTDIKVYPNPFIDYIAINTTINGIAIIYDISGKEILSVNVQNGYNRIETTAFPKGVYFIKIEGGVTKVVK